MVLEDENGTEGFSFIWTIQNFSYCLQQHGESLPSPYFVVDTLGQTEWRLKLYPKGELNPTTIRIDLTYSAASKQRPIEINYVLSIRSINGAFKKFLARKYIFATAKGYGSPCSLTPAQLFKRGVYLDNDTLTVQCRMWGSTVDRLTFYKGYAKTIIGVEKTVIMWNLENFAFTQNDKRTKKVQLTSTEMISFTIDLFWSGTSADEKNLQVEVKPTKIKQPYFTTCELSLLDLGGKTGHFVREEHYFEVSQGEQIWEFPFISKEKLLSLEKSCFPNSTMSLRCELAVSAGVQYSQVERTEFGITDNHQIRRLNETADLDLPGSWRDDLQRFYADGKFSDFTVRTPNMEFPVHKAILCARSGVFRAMLERDMKENRTGIVEIEDLDDDTVSKLLRFLYTDIVDELEWETAFKLFFAADKYELLALKRKCSNFIKTHVKKSNVCDALVLADAHQDQDLKSACEDFIGAHASEMLSSEEW